jgi:hypothetical protein
MELSYTPAKRRVAKVSCSRHPAFLHNKRFGGFKELDVQIVDLLSNKTLDSVLKIRRNQLPYIFTQKVKIVAVIELADEFPRTFLKGCDIETCSKSVTL